MKDNNEITVEINISQEELINILENNNYKLIEEYDLNDIYMINKNDINDKDSLSLLNKCILLRNIVEKDKITNYITYKHKEYNDKKEIIKQEKVNCHISNIESAKLLFEKLNYIELIAIKDKVLIYSNGRDELAIQRVNNKHIYIELEEKCSNTKHQYKSIDEMKEVINRLNISIKDNNYFAKKAEIELMENSKSN